MKKYIVKNEASVLYQIEVEAENEEQALAIGQKKLFDGEGSETPYSFEWQDWNKVEDYANNEVGR
jgi:hypothetical protein